MYAVFNTRKEVRVLIISFLPRPVALVSVVLLTAFQSAQLVNRDWRTSVEAQMDAIPVHEPGLLKFLNAFSDLLKDFPSRVPDEPGDYTEGEAWYVKFAADYAVDFKKKK